MKSSLKWLTVILGVSAFGLASASEKISWKKIDEALSLAKSQNKKLLIDFYSPTWGSCIKMDKETYSDDRVVVLSKDFIFVKVNTKEDTLTKKQYSVFATPTALMANADGQEIDRVVGFYPTEQFLPIIKDYQKGKNTLGDLEKKVNKNSKDVKLLYTLGDKYQWRGNNEKAAEMFTKVVELDPENKTGKADSSAFNLAYLKYRAKDYQGAIADFEMFKTEYTNPNLVGDAQIYIAVCNERMDNKAEAVKQYQQYLEMYPAGENADYAKEQIEKLTQKAEESQ